VVCAGADLRAVVLSGGVTRASEIFIVLDEEDVAVMSSTDLAEAKRCAADRRPAQSTIWKVPASVAIANAGQVVAWNED